MGKVYWSSREVVRVVISLLVLLNDLLLYRMVKHRERESDGVDIRRRALRIVSDTAKQQRSGHVPSRRLDPRQMKVPQAARRARLHE